MRLHWERSLGNLCLVSPRLHPMSHFPLLILLRILLPEEIVNCEYNYMLSTAES